MTKNNKMVVSVMVMILTVMMVSACSTGIHPGDTERLCQEANVEWTDAFVKEERCRYHDCGPDDYSCIQGCVDTLTSTDSDLHEAFSFCHWSTGTPGGRCTDITLFICAPSDVEVLP